MNHKNLSILFLLMIITGSLTFLTGLSFFKEEIIFVSLTQLMAGGIGTYLTI